MRRQEPKAVARLSASARWLAILVLVAPVLAVPSVAGVPEP